MPKRPIWNRNYICCFCGRIRRAPGAYPPGSLPPPECCGRPMRVLSYEQTIAVARLSAAERTDWLAAGGQVVERSGKRRWKPVW